MSQFSTPSFSSPPNSYQIWSDQPGGRGNIVGDITDNQTFTGQEVHTVTFPLKRSTSTPTGKIYCQVWNSSGTTLKHTFGEFDNYGSLSTSSWTNISFNDSAYTFVNDDVLVLYADEGSSSAHVLVGSDNDGAVTGINMYYGHYNGTPPVRNDDNDPGFVDQSSDLVEFQVDWGTQPSTSTTRLPPPPLIARF